MKERQQSTTKSFAVLGTASILVKILGLIYIPFQRHILGDYGDGVVAGGYTIFTLLFSVSNAGLPNSISKLVSEQTARGNHRAASKILKCSYVLLFILGAATSVFMLLGARFLANDCLHQPKAYWMMVFLSPTLLFTSVSCALRGYFQGRQRMVPVAVSQVLEQLLNSVFTVVFAALLIKYGVEFGAAGTTVGTPVGAMGAAMFLAIIFFGIWGTKRKKEAAHSSSVYPEPGAGEIYRTLIRYSLPAIISSVAANASNLIDANQIQPRLIAAGLSSGAATSLYGVYSYQYQRLFTVAIAFSTALVTSIIPAVSSASAVGDFKLMKHRINDGYKALYLVTIPSIAGLTFLANPILSFIFFSVKTGGSDLVVFGTWTGILMVIQFVQSGVLIALGRPVISSSNLIAGMIVKFILNYFLIAIPGINIKGAIISTAVGWVIAIVLNQYAIKNAVNIKTYYFRMAVKPFVASVVMGGFCYGLFTALDKILVLLVHVHLVANDIAVSLTVIAGIVVYFTVMVVIGGVTRQDISRLPMGGRILTLLLHFPLLRRKLNRSR